MHDVIVSGAGPAGSYFALKCASNGLDVLLLEKGSLGRPKCCAGGLLERSLKVMEDLPLPESLVERELTGFSFVVKGECFPLSLERPLGLMVRREAFDLFLAKSAEKAGAQIMDGVKVLGAKEGPDRVAVRASKGDFEARYLAIAEGVSSALTNQLMGRHPAKWSAMGSAVEVAMNAPPAPSMEIHLLSLGQRALRPGPSFPLTGAAFPLRNSVMISVVGKSCSAEGMRAGLRNMKDQIASRLVVKKEGEVCFHPLPIVPRGRMVSARAIVMGDAAGLVSPFSGEGLSSALMSASLGSQAITRACESGNAAELRRYEQGVRSNIVPRLTAASLVGPWLHWAVDHFGHERLIGNLARHRTLVDACVGFSGGELSLSDFAIRALPFLPFMLRSINSED